MKKYHKLHRHKDAGHKRSSKPKHRHKPKKEQHPVSESLLAPIQEVSKEKVKLDKNACGDYVVPQLEDDRKKKSKHPSTEKPEKIEKIERLDQEHLNIFAQNYLQKLRDSTNKKLVRHHSLEKSGDRLINKTKNLFRKEKSFNDAVQNVSIDLEVDIKKHRKDRKRRHRSEKNEEDEPIKEKREKHKSRKKLSKKSDKESRDDHQLQNRETKHKSKREKQRAKSSGKSPVSGNLYSRVQEVIYCQMDQVPYKLKHDKSNAEIKDLYQRIKREKSRGKEGAGTTKELPHFGDASKKYDLKKYMSYQSHYSSVDSKINIQEGKKNRSKSRSKREPEERIQKEKRAELLSKEHDTISKRHKKHCHHDPGGVLDNPSKKGGDRKRKKSSLSNIDLGPYQKYFAFENNDDIDCKKHRNKNDDQIRRRKEEKKSSRERKHRENREEVIYNVEYDHTPCKKHHTKHEGKIEKTEGKKLRTDEDKIHQIVEGDLKTYFTKIQHMIDKKLDAILQTNKSRHEKTSDSKLKERETRKRSKSRSKYTKSEKEEPSDSKKENRIKVDKNKYSNDDEADDDTREEIIQEVLRRIKNEERVQSISDELAIKHDSKDISHKKRKEDSKNIKDVSKTCKKCQELKIVYSRTVGVSLNQNPSNQWQPDNIKNLEQKVIPSPFNSSGKKHEEAKRLQNMNDNKQTQPFQHQDDRLGSREQRNSDISRINNPQELSAQRFSEKNRHSSEKRTLPKDTLGHNGGPPLELIVPAADISRVEWEAYLKSKRRYRNPYTGGICAKEDLSHQSLRKHYTSVSSCKACLEHHLEPEQKSEQHATHKHDDKHAASDGIRRKRGNPDRRRSSSHERRYKVSEETNRVEQNHVLYKKNDGMPSVDHKTHAMKEHGIAPCGDEYIVTPRQHRKSKVRSEDYRNSDMNRFRHDVVVQCPDPNLETIILPPEMFRTHRKGLSYPTDDANNQERVKSPKRQQLRPEFFVQGIEPPILESSRQKLGGRMRARNLECKTVSVVGIPPQMNFTDVPVTNVTQTSSKSQKSSNLDVDLVEKRKQSKRFKLYYKYSVVNNCKEDSGTSEAKSIVSDSYRVVSDPSDEEKSVCYSRDVKISRERQITSELSQVVNIPPKKWNRISTPRDSHLNNIIEEPSNISNSIKNDEFFIPILGTHECYFRALTSSHSEYCFKINKKPANSNISIVSKDAYEERYRYYDAARCRFCKRSKSDVNIRSNCHGIQIFRSKSDVFLAGASGKKAIRSIFLEDSTARSKQIDVPQILNREKNIIRTTGKVCQTSDEKVNYDVIPVDEDGKELVIEDKQRQFKDIYKTIDDLVENIHSSRRSPPNTLDIAVSSRFLSLDKLSDQKPLFKEIYKTIETLQNKMRDTSHTQLVKTVDVAIGSPVKLHRSQRASRSEPRRHTHEVAVGDSKDRMVKVRPGYRSVSRGKRLKSTGVSPIRVVEDVQSSSKSPRRITKTPISPNIRPYLTRPATQKPTRTVRDDIAKRTVPRIAETRRDPISLRPKVLVVKNTKMKSPERTEVAENQKNLRPADGSQPIQGIRVLRSDEKSATLEKRERIIPNRSRDRKSGANTTDTTGKNQTYQMEKSDNKTLFNVPNNNTQISRKVSARNCTSEEKGDVKKIQSRTSDDDVHKTCVHHYHPRESSIQKSSRSTVASIKTVAGTVQTPLTVNTALVKCRPASKKETVPCEGSTSSSLGDESAQNMRRSRSLVEVRAQNRNLNKSKSEIITVEKSLMICNSRGIETNAGSIISGNMERYANVPRLRCQSSKSAVHSLDQFTGNKFTSTLLLTKDYRGGEISAYQRRKLYDQSIRQKMKKKFRFSKLDVGPQIFEVRFLSMVRQENAQRKEKETRTKNHFDRHLVTLNLEKAKTEGNFRHRINPGMVKVDGEIPEIRKRRDEDLNNNINNNINPITKKLDHVSNKISDQCGTTENNFKSSNTENQATDVQKLQSNINHNKEVLINSKNVNKEEQSVVELYFKDQKFNQKKLLSFCNKLLEVNSSMEFPEEFKAAQCNCSKYSENCQSCKNFVNLMDMLCTSVASYCDSKTKLVRFKLDDDFEYSDVDDKPEQHIKKDTNVVIEHNSKEEFDNLHVQLPNLEKQDASKNVQEIFSRGGNNSSGESNESTDQRDRVFKNIVDCVSGSTTNNADNIQSLSQPLSCPVLATNASSFEFLYEETSSSDNQEISRDVVYANLTRPFDQTFNFSTSQFNVETPFFRRSSCFSPTGSMESGYASIKSRSCRKHSLTNFFKKPNIAPLLKLPVLQRTKTDLSKVCEQNGQGDFRKSILYEKMRKSCQLYAKKVRESSEMKVTEKVDDYQEYSLAFLLRKDSTLMFESVAGSQHSNTHSYIAHDVCNEDSELLDVEELVNLETHKEGVAFLDMNSFAEAGCKLVLTNEYLRTDSITYLGPEIFNQDEDLIFNVSQSQFGSKKDHDNTVLVNADSSFTLDFSLDSNNPFVPSKDVLTQRFFGSLLTIYEKEMELCNELFKNDEFLKNVLLPAVKEKKNEEKRNKKGRFSKFFRRKTPDKQRGAEKHKSKQTDNSQVKPLAKLQGLASNAKKCFTMLAEAVKVNENIDDEIKICGLLKLLERIETGDFYMIKNDGILNIEQDFQSQVTQAFVNIYEICEKEAKKTKRNIGDREINLIKGFVSKYRIGLLSKTDIVACYIGRGVIQTEAQLKAAVTYLMRCQANQVNIREFEEYCKFSKSFKK